MKQISSMGLGFFMGLFAGIILMTFLNEMPCTANEHIFTKVYKPDYNYRVDVVTAMVVSDTAQQEIYCIWYKNEIYLKNTINLK